MSTTTIIAGLAGLFVGFAIGLFVFSLLAYARNNSTDQ